MALKMVSDNGLKNEQQMVAALEARLESLVGPENASKRRRVRNRLKKLRDSSDPFAEAKAALPTVDLPPATTAQARAAGPARGRRPRSRSPPRGEEPNIAWRAITMEELRAHPSFVALPPAHRVLPTSAADLRLFRQDSRQWWACHAGRISTSACASCLGVYEERSSSRLGVPPSLRGHGKALDAHARLSEPVLAEAQLSLLHPDCRSGWGEDGMEEEEEARERAAAAVWRPPVRVPHEASDDANRDDGSARFLCEYRPRKSRGRGSRNPTSGGRASYQSVGQIRMAWGSVQEATSILAALNYFGARNATVEEAGLQPLEALSASERAALPDGLPPIGASPDAIVRWPDGSVEPFEVKNHAPFANNFRVRSDPSAPRFEVRDPGPYDEIATWHVPQLYLHMLCLGATCQSALFMSASATKGVHIFRLRRNEQLMQRMLGFVARFASEYGFGRAPPKPDYFWGSPGYDLLLDGLARASREDVELVARVPNGDVQRGKEAPFFFS